jgi:hypothetical protein
MTAALQLVSEQFPLLRDRVALLFERDSVFQELCEDYGVCAEALARQPASEGLRREYTALRLRLETELLEYLNDTERRRAARP